MTALKKPPFIAALLLTIAFACVAAGSFAATTMPRIRTVQLKWQTITVPEADWKGMVARTKGDPNALTSLLLSDDKYASVTSLASTDESTTAAINTTAKLPYDASPSAKTPSFVIVGQNITIQPIITPDKRIRTYITVRDIRPVDYVSGSGAAPTLTVSTMGVAPTLLNGQPIIINQNPETVAAPCIFTS